MTAFVRLMSELGSGKGAAPLSEVRIIAAKNRRSTTNFNNLRIFEIRAIGPPRTVFALQKMGDFPGKTACFDD